MPSPSLPTEPDPVDLAALDLCDLDRFAHGFPHEVFTALRAAAPVWWHPPTPNTPDGEGFWVITTHRDVMAVLHDPETFSSETGPGRTGGGTTLLDMPPGLVTGVMLNMSDPPTHERIRGLVNRSFTPRAIELLDPWLRERAAHLVEVAVERGQVDFVVDVAAELPLQTIAELMGVPQSDRHRLFEWTSTILDYGDRSLTDVTDELVTAGLGLRGYADDIIAERRAAPGADLLSRVVTTDPALSPEEEQAFFSLLFTAGSETTRNSIAGGVLALVEHPDQWVRLRADRTLLSSAVEEILRWTSATAYNRRTVRHDTTFAGQHLLAGQKTTHWYPSANRDDAVFADPFAFDVTRSPNPHLAFGHGIHHCLGAALARREITVLLEALLERVDHVELRGEVEWGRSNKHTSMRHLPVELVV